MGIIIAQVSGTLIKPPMLMLLMMLTGILLRSRFYRTGQSLLYAGVALLVLLSLPIVSGSLVRFYESIPPVDNSQLKTTRAQAIVILAGGRNSEAPEYNKNDTVHTRTLERIRYGAHLQKITGLPVLVTGGKVYGDEPISEAELMQQVLVGELDAKVSWVEKQSRTTYENAIYSQTILASQNISHILLVTHAIHMPRSVEAFKQAGFNVTPAPTGFHTRSTGRLIQGILPKASALKDADDLFHEIIGRAWYHLKYY